MLGSRVGIKVGHRVGVAVGVGEDAIAPGGGWTKDPTSLMAVPKDLAEWGALLSAAGDTVGAPFFGLGFQEASGNLSSLFGGLTFTATAGSPALSYGQTISGWSRKFAGPGGDNSSGLWQNTDASLPNAATDDIALMGWSIFQATPAGTREWVAQGTTGRNAARLTATPRLQCNNGTNVATGSSAPTAAVRWWVLQLDRTNSVTALFTDQEKVIATYAGTVPTGKRILIGGAGANAPQCAHGYMVGFRDAAARRSQAQWKTLGTTMGATIPWSPA